MGLACFNLTILNGTQGINEVERLVGQGVSILETLKKSAAVTASEKEAVMLANGTVERVG